MQEISEVLINARKKKGVGLDQAVRDTNISKMFLQGLESDNYEDFPAETYVLGFLRNYANYLGLDPEQIVKLYKQTKLQESNIPQEVILNKKSFDKKPFFLATAIVVAVLIVGLLSILIWKSFFHTSNSEIKPEIIQETKKTDTENIITENKSKNKEINEESYQGLFFEGDSFSIKLGEETYIFKVNKTLSDLELETDQIGTQIIKLGESVKLDLNNDTKADVEILLGDIDKTDASKGAHLLIKTGASIGTNSNPTTVANANYTTIFESASPYPVTMNITFRNYCFFRYEIDRANRKEQYYQRNSTLSIRADNGFRIWASNGNAVKIQLVGAGRSFDLELTKPGEVIVQDIKWLKDENTKRYRFVVADVE